VARRDVGGGNASIFDFKNLNLFVIAAPFGFSRASTGLANCVQNQ